MIKSFFSDAAATKIQSDYQQSLVDDIVEMLGYARSSGIAIPKSLGAEISELFEELADTKSSPKHAGNNPNSGVFKDHSYQSGEKLRKTLDTIPNKTIRTDDLEPTEQAAQPAHKAKTKDDLTP
ncbi:MAG: hypothetical protein OQK24_10645 [Magnetovibrio sp.]|nr:hypothetical protein [Magnetovibrio sp.]